MRKALLALILCGGMLYVAPMCAIAQDKKEADKTENEEKEPKLKPDQIPAAVKKTLDKESDHAAFDDVEKQTHDGKTIYEADVQIDGKGYEIRVAEDGTLISKKLESGEDEEQKDDEAAKK